MNGDVKWPHRLLVSRTEDQALCLRLYGPGDYEFHGADSGILATKGRMQILDGLTERCRRHYPRASGASTSPSRPTPPVVMPIAYVK